MNNSDLARRTEISVKVDGRDISDDINKYLISLSYTDNEEDATDDLQIVLDDREGMWLEWLKTPPAPPTPEAVPSDYKIGDIVYFKGGLHHYTSLGNARGGNRSAGQAKITVIAKTAPFPYHLIAVSGGGSNVYGWVKADQID